MKRFISLFAAAAVAILSVSGCYTESTEALYSIIFSIGNQHEYFRTGSEEAEKALDEIKTNVNTFTKSSAAEWKETIKNKDFSSADASAKARYESVLAEFKKLETESKAKIAALPTGLPATIDYTWNIKLERWAPDGNSADLDQYSFTITY
jgi:1,4-alpha-glucan branching enzyme